MDAQYAGSGFTNVEVEGARFNILLGTDPEDVKRWREQRRARWPSRARLARDAEAAKPPCGLAALAAYDSDDSDEPPPQKKQRQEKVCLAMLHGGRCRRGAECSYSHDVANVPICRFFTEPGGCRRGRGCRNAHRADPVVPPRGVPGSLLAQLLRHDVATEAALALQCLTALLDAADGE
jgi:hypothetical protein